MTVSEILYFTFIVPLQLFFELVFTLVNRHVSNPGYAIIVLSLMINFLVLPLYRRSDTIQEEERDIEAKLARGVAHIKKVFKGDEKMMMLRTYYRQNNYLPTDAIKGSLSLFLEIPFFIAAYQFLSHLDLIKGVAFGPIADLGAPDALLTVAGVSINVLPIVMTAVNLVSSAIFVQGYPLKTKIQLYAMALFFLVFLYPSPSGLVFYWTLNNLFALVKTILYKVDNPRKIIAFIASVSGVFLIVYGLFFFHDMVRNKAYLVILGIWLQLPVLREFGFIKQRIEKNVTYIPNIQLFWAASLFLAVLIGLLIPASVIQASPQEFVNLHAYSNPVWYAFSTFCVAGGLFLFWMRIFYWISTDRWKVKIERFLCCFSGIAIIDYMFFGTNLGTLTPLLRYERGLKIESLEKNINLILVIILAMAMYYALHRYRKAVVGFLVTGILSLSVMSAVNIYDINQRMIPLKERIDRGEIDADKNLKFSLSRNGKNVVVIMLDRAIGPYIPYLFAEKPELRELYAGFTYYSNTISFGGHTNFGTPGLFGGYEYTPIEMNKRSTELLEEKQNEALKVMPVLFSKNGYEVTVCNPVYANYQWIPDTSIYNEYPDIHAYNAMGSFVDSENIGDSRRRNFFFYGVMKVSPLLCQSFFYDQGQYNRATETSGVNQTFLDAYNLLKQLNVIGEIEDSDKNTFFMMANDATHEIVNIQEPEYVPAAKVDNTEYEATHKDRFVVNGRKLRVETDMHQKQYATTMATFLALGEWMEYLKANDVYDNTRIIIVADHGHHQHQFDELWLNINGKEFDAERFAPLLMVKEFNSRVFTEEKTFMTNADVPTLAVTGVIENPINPFTGKLITSAEKTSHKQYIITSPEYHIDKNNGTQFWQSDWLTVHDDIWNKDNWELAAENAVLEKYE